MKEEGNKHFSFHYEALEVWSIYLWIILSNVIILFGDELFITEG